jgi:pimeloyl-ACP methyl ester carboxylesterase
LEAIDHNGWTVRQSGPPDAEPGVLLLPGGLETGAFYDQVVAEVQRVGLPIRCVTTTLPGYGGASPVTAATFEERARQAGSIATAFRCQVVVGHSVGANVALEIAAGGSFAGSLILLSPSFSRSDESIVPRVLDRLSRVLGSAPYALMLRFIGPLMTSSLPPARSDALIREFRRNDPGHVQRETRAYLDYLDRRGSVAERLCQSGVRAWAVFGERDDVRLADEERRVLESCHGVELTTIPDAGHFALIERPDLIAQLILKAIQATPIATNRVQVPSG